RVSAATLAAVAGAPSQGPAPVGILPGNHEPVLQGPHYPRASLGANVHVLSTPGGETWPLAGLDLDIWGRPHCAYEDFRPLAGIPPRGAAGRQVAPAARPLP